MTNISEFPPELIADEYERHNKDNKILYIFYDKKHEEYTKNYQRMLENETCKCAKTFPITTHAEVLKYIGDIENEQSSDEKDCLMLLFLGTLKGKTDEYVFETDDKPLKDTDVWKPLANNRILKYRPKIFLFHAFIEDKNRNSLQTDAGGFKLPFSQRYDIPNEADVLLIYKKTTAAYPNCDRIHYFKNLSSNLEKFGHRDDLVSILTYTDSLDVRPLIVSTLRKKVFFTRNKHRSHWYDIHTNIDDSLNELKEIQDNFVKWLENKTTTVVDSSADTKPSSVKTQPSENKIASKVTQKKNGARDRSNDSILYYFVIIAGVSVVVISIMVAAITKLS